MNLFTPLLTLVLFAGLPLHVMSSEQMNTQEAFHKARVEQKNIFIYYTSDWCEVCSVLQDSILTNPYIQAVISEEYVMVRANLANPESQEWFERYQVNCLPTIQIIDIEGNLLIERLSTYEEELYSDLLDYAIPKDLTSSLEMNSNLQNGNQHLGELNQHTKSNTHSLTAHPTQDSVTKSFSVHPDAASTIRTIGHNEIQFTVTVGAYTILRNAEQFQRSLSHSYDSIDIFIEADQDKKLYRVNAGRFSSRASCRSVIEKLKTENVDCYVRKLL